MASHQEGEALGAISQLAKYLRPFAGDAAELAAQRLVGRFGSPGRLLSASDAAILDALDDNPAIGALIVAARDLTDFAAKAVVRGERVDPRSPQMKRYLSLTLGGGECEVFMVIFCDADRGFLASEVMGIGTESKLDFPIRPMMTRAFELGARGILLAHNHPSGIAAPSQQDRRETARVRDLCSPLGIEIIDHLIVARGRVYSMARECLL